jgi:hypothetical protein
MGRVVLEPLWRWWCRGSAKGERRGEAPRHRGTEAPRTGWAWNGQARAGPRKGGESAQRSAGARGYLWRHAARPALHGSGARSASRSRGCNPRLLGAAVDLDAADDGSQSQTLGSTPSPECSLLSPFASWQRYGLCPFVNCNRSAVVSSLARAKLKPAAIASTPCPSNAFHPSSLSSHDPDSFRPGLTTF